MQGQELIESILSAWDVGPVCGVTELRPGIVFRVDCDSGTSLVLKDIGASESRVVQRFEFEYEVLRHLGRAGISIALPFQERGGAPYVVRNGHLYTLSPFLSTDSQWEDLDRDGLKRLNAHCGAAIARLHMALASFPAQDLESRTWKTVLPDAFLECIPVIQQNLCTGARTLFDDVIADVAASIQATTQGLPMQLIHRDCHHGNIIVHGEQVSGFVDCDHLSIGPRVFDIADFIVHMVKQFVADEQRTAEWFVLFPAVLHGYEQESPLLRQEKRALSDVMLGVVLMFVAWFFRTGDSRRARSALDAFVWMAHHRDRISREILSA